MLSSGEANILRNSQDIDEKHLLLANGISFSLISSTFSSGNIEYIIANAMLITNADLSQQKAL